MRHDPFFKEKEADPDAVVKSKPVAEEKGFKKAALPVVGSVDSRVSGGPRVIETDTGGEILRVGESSDPAESFSPGCAEPTLKVWSDEAREAAAEARERNRGSSQGEGRGVRSGSNPMDRGRMMPSGKPPVMRPEGYKPRSPEKPKPQRFGGRFDPKDPRRRQWA